MDHVVFLFVYKYLTTFIDQDRILSGKSMRLQEETIQTPNMKETSCPSIVFYQKCGCTSQI